ncbi:MULTISPECIES: DUF6303 family protein [Streptomyces]|uniref:Uncharacterized protein n=1 Tax=Streptomyces griseus subsp. griseus (strain JCM 4626 / CBS 651.72 / NBRC 13350 / KCC S-0626 / ISP 5235) TaxID=455632 RepID=B1W4S6_STRGG|nr:DUF6303 family protein [Streptomyces griseus]KUJ52149.1 hypothetical protein ACZ90_66755 [Streptomyces albus subsp. albus]MBW3705360.1 hypothetical protein [Streptomyces griseus]SEE87610.1 hypothetical protein SAMN04490359_6635 [Streptomyces griseus]SQA23594.1 Uncharacterised protein [Streptomyces griseus]BAG19720.1 hypothetical protein SGR_2891 [Streptomyces griseus subsp. griseus NBRC 13350]
MNYGARLSNSFLGEWELYVVTDGISLNWPEHSFGRTGPVPTVQERADALTALGFVLADDAGWEWQECPTGVMDRVELLASANVQRKDGAA